MNQAKISIPTKLEITMKVAAYQLMMHSFQTFGMANATTAHAERGDVHGDSRSENR
jgi:hypothetical protein